MENERVAFVCCQYRVKALSLFWHTFFKRGLPKLCVDFLGNYQRCPVSYKILKILAIMIGTCLNLFSLEKECKNSMLFLQMFIYFLPFYPCSSYFRKEGRGIKYWNVACGVRNCSRFKSPLDEEIISKM